jgi:hypothetical protein
MCGETWYWIVFPMIFLGMMILCMFVSRRRKGGWCCGSAFADRSSHEGRISRVEEELRNLKNR